MLADMWVVVEMDSGRILGAWTDLYTARGTALSWEEEHKVDCVVLGGELTYGGPGSSRCSF